jgi:hypothetical protein
MKSKKTMKTAIFKVTVRYVAPVPLDSTIVKGLIRSTVMRYLLSGEKVTVVRVRQ